MLGNENKFSFHLLYQNFALSLNKISCISTKKINRNLFCFVFDLDKFFMLGNENKFSFHLLYQNFALSLQMDMLMMCYKCRVGKIRYHGVDWI